MLGLTTPIVTESLPSASRSFSVIWPRSAGSRVMLSSLTDWAALGVVAAADALVEALAASEAPATNAWA